MSTQLCKPGKVVPFPTVSIPSGGAARNRLRAGLLTFLLAAMLVLAVGPFLKRSAADASWRIQREVGTTVQERFLRSLKH